MNIAHSTFSDASQMDQLVCAAFAIASKATQCGIMHVLFSVPGVSLTAKDRA